MTVNVSNTNLNDSFNTWRLNTNLLATVVSNNVVTVSREGSANRGGAAKGNGHVSGTFSATNLRTGTLKGGNTTAEGALTVASNTVLGGTTLTVSANAEFTGNVNFTTSGTDRLVLGDVSRIRVTGGSEGQFLRVSGATDSLDFKDFTLRDIGDLSSNSAHIILSGANASFGEALDSTHLIFAGGSGVADRVNLFLAGDATIGDSDLYVKLVDDAGDSAFVIADSSNNNVASIDSAGTAAVKILNAADELSVGTASGKGFTSSLIPKDDSTHNIGSASRKVATVWADTTKGGTGSFTNLGASGTFTANGNATFNGSQVTIANDLIVQGTTTISSGQAFTADSANIDDMTVSGSSTLQGNVVLSTGASIVKYGTTTVIGNNNKLHANNTITDKTILTNMIANTVTSGATVGSTTQIPVFTFNDRGQITGATTADVSGVSSIGYTQSNNTIEVDTVDGANFSATIDPATTTQSTGRGVSSFNSTQFSVNANGHVSIGSGGSAPVLTVQGTSNEVNVSRTQNEVTIGLPDDVTVSGQLNVGENVVVTGNLIVQGTTTTVESETVRIHDNIIVLNSDESGTPSQNAGFTVERGTSTNYSLLWDETSDRWTVGDRDLVANNFIGALEGNADTATALETSRTIAGKTFDGTQNVTLSALSAGSYINGSSFNGSSAVTWNLDAAVTNVANKAVVRDGSGSFAASTITAALNGNASTASALLTSRTIGLSGDLSGSASFDGSSDITISATVSGGFADTAGDADTLDGIDGSSFLRSDANDTATGNLTLRHIYATSDSTYDIGTDSVRYRTMYADTFNGRATSANFADLAEKYLADAEYPVGTVVSVGGDAEVTATDSVNAHSVLGVVSDSPAYLMNQALEGGTIVALKGRVPVRITGTVKKGDRLAPAINGLAMVDNDRDAWSFAIALEDSDGETVEAVIL